ncbi:MAG TPA: glycosyltransferase family 39 protein [Longimicrobiales bacterium]|nr:glycosyltransferase family 39 protein [Longimicrobiales bacterium]
MSPPAWAPTQKRERVAFMATWAAAATYVLVHLNVGWLPADAGTLGYAAERVLNGELPHRDFTDVYTGGLAALHALSFRVFGVGVMSMRWVTYAVFLAWVPAFWLLAARLSSTWIAVLATLLAVSWSLPVYPEAMPSWYNLFLATFGAVALLWFLDTRRRSWLLLAGVAGGLSVLVKITGLYYIAAAGLFLMYDEAHGSGTARGADVGARSDLGYRCLAIGGCLALAAAVVWLVLRGIGARHFLLYGVPPLAAITPVAWALRSPSGSATSERVRRIARTAVPFLAGATLPVAAWVIPYALSGSVGAMLEGVLIRPSGRLDSVRIIGPVGPWWYAVPAVALVLWHALASRRGRVVDRLSLGAGWAIILLMLLGSAEALPYVTTFRTLVWLSPLVTVAAAWTMTGGGRDTSHGVLMLALFGLMSLVQVPFAAPVYLFYSAPLGILVAVEASEPAPPPRRTRLVVSLAGLCVFSVLRLNEGVVVDIGFRYRPHEFSEELVLSRAMGLRVSPAEKTEYEGVVELVREVGGEGPIFAGPDAPEVYFLTGRTNPTGILYDVLDASEARDAGVLEAVERPGVQAVVVRTEPFHSAPFSKDLLAEIERHFPAVVQVGRFIVAWRPPEP